MDLRRNSFVRFVGRHWLSIFFIVAMCLSIWASYISWNVSRDNTKQNELICANVVSSRQSQRFLWDTIVTKFTQDPNAPAAIEFKRTLNEILPYLICVNNVPTPVGN